MRDERQYVLDTLTDCLDGTCHQWDWHGFVSRALRDVELDRIRLCAAAFRPPLDGEGRAALLALRDQAELVGASDPAKPRPWRVEAGILAGLAVGGALWWNKYLPGMSLFSNLHLILGPAAAGMFLVLLRNSQKKVGAYEPRIVEQNRKGRV